ncbi:MAG: hypothetical protein KME04_07615 [Pleurocapsa minor GSE-CHR-MK-17-07R]|jgi:hypothetical protein|nr:hypothetical protein [Pleurocapsa minor GSE-CHR-MK 17-07R]
MQTIIDAEVRPSEHQASIPRAIPVEWIAYVLLLGLALVLRLASLGDIPLSPAETHDALAAWRAISPSAPGDPLIASSPTLFLAQAVGFTTLGSSEFAARFIVAISGAFLCITPALFRRQLGAGHAFVFSLMLAISPVVLAASRFSSPVIFSALFAVIMLWCLSQFAATRHSNYGIGLVVSAAALITLGERGGLALFIIVALSVIVGWRWQASVDARYSFDDDAETPDEKPASVGLFDLLRAIPVGLALAVTALVVFLTATIVMLYPAGLTSVGEVLAGAVSGFVSAPDSTQALARFSSPFYETFGWGLAISAIIVLYRRDSFTLADRIFTVWLIAGLAATAFFIGGNPAHGLWTAIPVAALAARLVLLVLQNDAGVGEWNIPAWARYVVALVGVSALAAFTMAVQGVGRSLTFSPDGSIASAPIEVTSLILLIVVIMFSILAVFMAATLWSMRTAGRGVALAFIIFGGLTSLGTGWRLSVPESDSPFHLWHTNAAAPDNVLLTATLREIAERESRGFDLVDISVLAAQDGLIAWHTRTFQNTTFITEPSQAVGQPVVIIDANIVPDLGGAYIGQDFTITRQWSPASAGIVDYVAWWTQNQVSQTSLSTQVYGTAYLWLRQDIWQGIDVQ